MCLAVNGWGHMGTSVMWVRVNVEALDSPAVGSPLGAPMKAQKGPPARASRMSGEDHACVAVGDGGDAWALALLWSLAVTAAAVGLRRLVVRGAAEGWNDGRDSLLWAAVAAALVEAAPGTLFLGCALCCL